MNKTAKIVVTALFAALCCIATMIIRIPTVGTAGYVNIGDTVVLFCAWILGEFGAEKVKGVINPEGIAYAAVAAGIGSMLADLLSGYPVYVPGTFVVKACMAAVAVIVFRSIVKFNKFAAHVVSAILAEVIMIVGYFLYESTLLGYGMAAAASIPSNAIQGVTCLVLAVALIEAIEASKSVYTAFKIN